MKKLLSVILLAFSANAVAETITIGVENLDYLPYYITKKGKFQGFAGELFDKFSAKTTHKIVVKPMPVARLFKSLVNKKIQAKFPDNAFWGAADKKKFLPNLNYSNRVVSFTDAVLTTKDKPEVLRVSMVRGFSPGNEAGFKYTEVNSIKAATEVFIGKRVDAVFGNVEVIKYAYKQAGGTGDLVPLGNSSVYNSHYHLSAFNDGFLKELNKYLESSEYKDLLDKHGLSV